MIHSNSTPSTPAQKSKPLRGFPSMNFTRFHRKVTPSFFSASSSEASSSQTSLHALDACSPVNSRTTSSTSSPAESTSDGSPNVMADLVGRPIMDPKLLNELVEGRDPCTLLAKPTQPPLIRSKSAEPLVKSDASQDFSPLSSRRPCAREDRFYRPYEHSDTEDPVRPASSQSGPLKTNMRFPF